MNKRVVYGALIIGIAVAVLVAWWFFSSGSQLGKEVQKSQVSAPAPTSAIPAPVASSIPPKDLEAMRKGLEAWGEKIQKGGAKIVPPPLEQLRVAVGSGDKGTILRAFHDVVYSRYKSGEVIQALKEFLNDADPFVRYEAAESLLIVGDRSGYSTLLGLVQANEPIDGIGQDVRIKAARTLAKFREKDAAQAIYDLYKSTPNSGLLSELLKLGINVTSIYEAKGFSPYVMQGYAKANVESFIPQIKMVYEQTPKPDVKVAAAWAFASMTGDQNATNYLVQQAQALLTNPGMLDGTKEGGAQYAAGADAIKYLGTLQTPEAKQTLEAALNNQDPSIVRVATVNLIFNQGGSEKANQIVVQELSGQESLLGIDLALSIAAQVNDPQVQAAGQSFDQRHAGGSWQLYTVERKDWPIYNWIDDYVVKLNKERRKSP